MAGIVRRTRSTGSIAGVYTPPAQRGRGYAGSVTAAVVERIYAEGMNTACSTPISAIPNPTGATPGSASSRSRDSMHIIRLAPAHAARENQTNAPSP